MLTQQRLKQALRYAKRTGVFTWRISRPRGVRSGDIAGGLNPQGYVVISIDGTQYRAHRLAWLYVTGFWPCNEIDHRDGARNNNAWRNLRDVTRTSNAQNQQKPHARNASSKVLGVFRQNASNKRWRARICVNGQRINLGSYATPEEASEAYQRAKQQHHDVGV